MQYQFGDSDSLMARKTLRTKRDGNGNVTKIKRHHKINFYFGQWILENEPSTIVEKFSKQLYKAEKNNHSNYFSFKNKS